MMKKNCIYIIVGILLLCLNGKSFHATAQLLSNRTQSFHSPSITYAAFTGIENGLNADLAFRQASNAYGSGSGSYYVGLFVPIIKNKAATNNISSFKLSNPDLIQEEYNSKSAKRRQGVGILINQTNLGHYSNFNATAQYAYHLPISKTFFWSFATAVSFQQHTIGLSNLQVRDELNDPLYQRIINSNEGNQLYSAIDLSTAFYSQRFFASASIQNIASFELGDNSTFSDLTSPMRISVFSGVKIPIGYNFTLLPILQVSKSELYETQLSTSVRVRYKDIIYLGGSIEYDNRFSGLFGVRLPQNLFLHYSYDVFQNSVKEFASGVSEISLSFFFDNKSQKLPYTW